MSLASCVIGDAEFLERLWLRGVQELEQLRHVERVGAVVVLGIAGEPAGASGFAAVTASGVSGRRP